MDVYKLDLDPSFSLSLSLSLSHTHKPTLFYPFLPAGHNRIHGFTRFGKDFCSADPV